MMKYTFWLAGNSIFVAIVWASNEGCVITESYVTRSFMVISGFTWDWWKWTIYQMTYVECRRSSKIVSKIFWIIFPAYYHSPGSYESPTKSFRKFEQKVDQQGFGIQHFFVMLRNSAVGNTLKSGQVPDNSHFSKVNDSIFLIFHSTFVTVLKLLTHTVGISLSKWLWVTLNLNNFSTLSKRKWFWYLFYCFSAGPLVKVWPWVK